MSDHDRLGPPPVEPMTNTAWTRVERGLFERLDQPASRPLSASRPRWPWLAIPAFAVAAAAVIAILVATRETSEPPIVVTPTPSPIVPSRVVAGDTPSMVSYGDAHLTVDAHAAIVMDREGGSPSVLVERGEVSFSVAPREGAPYIVRAGDVVVRVVGTQFRVARYEERVTVAVERGLVDVQFRGEVHRLSAGQAWSSHEQTASNSPAPTPAPIPEPVVEPVVEPAAPLPAPTKPALGPSGKIVVEKTNKVRNDEDAAKFRFLSSIERKDPARAIEGYLELSQGNSEWSANALYAAGRLAFDRAEKRARTFLTIYLQRFPKGRNAEDARQLLNRLDGENP